MSDYKKKGGEVVKTITQFCKTCGKETACLEDGTCTECTFHFETELKDKWSK